MSGPTYLKRFARQTIKVDGAAVEVFIMGKGATLPIGADLSEEMDRVSAQLGYWTAVAAEAKSEAIGVDAQYRAFRANAANAVLEATPNLAEWKVKARVDATAGFLQHKNAIAAAEKNLSLCEGMVLSFSKKANQLQSIGANTRSQMGAQGMTTPKRPKRGWDLSSKGSEHDDDPADDDVESLPDGSDPASSSSDEREKRMNEINAKRQRDKAKGKKTKGAKKVPKKKRSK